MINAQSRLPVLVRRTAAVATLGLAAGCSSAPDGAPVRDVDLASTLGAQSLPPGVVCDVGNPSTWRYVVDQAPPSPDYDTVADTIGILIDGETVSYPTCLEGEDPNVCEWEHAMRDPGQADRTGALGWRVDRACQIHGNFAYDLMFFSRLGSTEVTWETNDAYRNADKAPVFSLSYRPRLRCMFGRCTHVAPVPIYTYAGPSKPPVYNPDYTARAAAGIAAGDPTTHPL